MGIEWAKTTIWKRMEPPRNVCKKHGLHAPRVDTLSVSASISVKIRVANLKEPTSMCPCLFPSKTKTDHVTIILRNEFCCMMQLHCKMSLGGHILVI